MLDEKVCENFVFFCFKLISNSDYIFKHVNVQLVFSINMRIIKIVLFIMKFLTPALLSNLSSSIKSIVPVL